MSEPLRTVVEAPASGRVFAVVASDEARAREVVRCFSRQGERVQTDWYPDAHALVLAEETPRFEAVILFAPEDCPKGDAEEMELRGAFRGLPIYRL